MLVVLAPWMAFNASRFERPTLMTTGTGFVLLLGSCDATYEGVRLGYYSLSCLTESADQWAVASATADESVRDERYRAIAEGYLSEHQSRMPVVAAARVGRAWEVYRFGESIDLNVENEHRAEGPTRLAFWTYWVLSPFSIAGLVVLRRRREPITPFVGVMVTVTVTSALTVPRVTRYRVPWDAAEVVLATVALDALLGHPIWNRRIAVARPAIRR